MESAHKVVAEHLNTVEQLRKINLHANELLDLLMRWNRGDPEALQILESQIRKVKVRGSEEEVKEYRFKDPRELALRAMAEIRGQLTLQFEILETLCGLQAVADFQREVLEAIKEVAPDVQMAIWERLRRLNAIRQTVSIT